MSQNHPESSQNSPKDSLPKSFFQNKVSKKVIANSLGFKKGKGWHDLYDEKKERAIEEGEKKDDNDSIVRH